MVSAWSTRAEKFRRASATGTVVMYIIVVHPGLSAARLRAIIRTRPGIVVLRGPLVEAVRGRECLVQDRQALLGLAVADRARRHDVQPVEVGQRDQPA